MIIAAVEDLMIAACQAVLGRSARTVESLPSGLTVAELAERMRVAPAVYVAFLGGSFRDEDSAVFDAQYGAFFLGQTAGDEKLARRGTPTMIGAYAMFELCVPALHGLRTDWGALRAKQANNLFSPQADRQGLALYSAAFSLLLTLPRAAAVLPELSRVYLQYEEPGHDSAGPLPIPANQAIAADLVVLPPEGT